MMKRPAVGSQHCVTQFFDDRDDRERVREWVIDTLRRRAGERGVTYSYPTFEWHSDRVDAIATVASHFEPIGPAP